MWSFPGSLPPSRSPSPAPRGSEPHLPESSAEIAFGDGTQNLPSHVDRVSRSISVAARMTVMIDFLSLPGAKGDPQHRKAACARLAMKRSEVICQAIESTLATAMDPEMDEYDQRELITRSILDEVDDAVVPQVFEDMREEVRKCNSATLKETLALNAWLHLLRAYTAGRETIERIDKLLASGTRPCPEIIRAALARKRYDVVVVLVDKRVVDLAAPLVTEEGEELTLMAYAIKHDIPPVIMTLINFGAPIPDYVGGVSPLEIVYKRGQIDLFQHLIARGANTDILIDGKTLLGKIIIDSEHHGNLFVVGVGFEELVKGTLSKPFAWCSKFNLKATGANGQNVLHDCCCADYYNQQIFMTLVAKGVDPFAKDRNGDTPVSLVYKKTAETEGREPPLDAKRRFEAEIRRNMPRKTRHKQ